MGLNIYMYDQSHWSFFLCTGKMQPKVGSKVVLEEFKLCTYMYVIACRNILHTHTHTHTQHTHTHTHLHCSFFLLTYTPRSVVRHTLTLLHALRHKHHTYTCTIRIHAPYSKSIYICWRQNIQFLQFIRNT